MPPALPGPELVRSQILIEAFRLSPDGGRIIYVRRHIEGNAYRSHLWVVDATGGSARQLTRGAVRDSSPSFAPDGRQVAFVRTPEGGEHGQVWVLPIDGGEPWQLTRLPHGVSSVVWSPRGDLLAVSAASDELPFIQGPVESGKAPRVRRIRRLDWRDDEVGHRDRRSHLFLTAPEEGAEPRQLTSGDFDVVNPSWSPDGTRLAFAADPRPDADIHPRSSIWTIGIDDDQPREVAALRGDADRPAYSPDGHWLAFAGTDVTDHPEYEPWAVWIVPAGGGEPRALNTPDDTTLGTWAWSDMDLAESRPGPAWIDDRSLAVIVSRRARCIPYRLSLDGGDPEPLASEDRLLTSGIEAQGGRVAISAALDGRAGELYAVESWGLRPLTTESSWQADLPMPELIELEIAGPGGPINTWLASAPGAGDRPLPLILHLHGGPVSAFGPGGSFDALLLTAAGYRVAMPNIRGSATFGYEWAHALNGHWGEVDAEDALAVVDALVERRLADPRRIGAFGLSYGGFMVQWLVGVTNRFAAAVAENGVANQVSTWSNCFFAVPWNRRGGLGDPLTEEGMLEMWRRSPLAHAGRIRTPLLILQSEEDRICPPADNEQLFTALRVLGREAEYLLYPEEHHELKNYGRPDRRIDRLERILDWFGRHLAPQAAEGERD